jgi:hypothetical protein
MPIEEAERELRKPRLGAIILGVLAGGFLLFVVASRFSFKAVGWALLPSVALGWFVFRGSVAISLRTTNPTRYGDQMDLTFYTDDRLVANRFKCKRCAHEWEWRMGGGMFVHTTEKDNREGAVPLESLFPDKRVQLGRFIETDHRVNRP